LRERAEAGRLLAAEANSPAYAQLRWLGEIIRPTLERHFLTLILLQSHGTGRLTKKTLEERAHLLAQRLSLLYAFNAPEFAERTAFASFIATLLDHGMLSENEEGFLAFDQRLDAAAAQAELVLAAEPREAIRRMAGESAAR
jgi:glycerol-3-phosphate O-acyltransferase